MGAFYSMPHSWNLSQWFKRQGSARIEPAVLLTSETADQINHRNKNRFTDPATGHPLAGQVEEDEIAHQLAHIWEKLLGIEFVAMDENYFDLGGDSSLTIQLFVQIKKQFGVEVPIITLFEAPTVAELANSIRRAQLGISGVASPESNHK